MAGQSINFHFQKNAFVEKFRPLTYYEIATGKELIAPIPGSKYVFRSPMQSITTVLRFHELSTGLLAPVERMMEASAQKTAVAPDKLSNDSVTLIQGVVAIAKVLWELADKPSNPFTRRKMWKAYSKAFMTDTVWFFDLLQKFKDFNQRFFFTMKCLRTYKAHQDRKWEATDFSILPEDHATRIARRSLWFSPAEKLKRQAKSANMN